MAPLGPAPAIVGKETSLSLPVSRRKLSRASTASISVSCPLAAAPSNQARKRTTAAPSRRCAARALDLDRVLHRLHQHDRVATARELAAVAGDEARERIRSGRLIDAHGLFGLAERREVAGQARRLAQVGERLQLVAH